jgi:hypothetical protein
MRSKHSFLDRAARIIAGVTVCAVACSDNTTVPTPAPVVRNVSTPFPIDAEPADTRPTSYKQLPLALTTQPAPSITPVDGVIGVVCIGMSNANQECGRLLAATNAGGPWAAELSPAVRACELRRRRARDRTVE